MTAGTATEILIREPRTDFNVAAVIGGAATLAGFLGLIVMSAPYCLYLGD